MRAVPSRVRFGLLLAGATAIGLAAGTAAAASVGNPTNPSFPVNESGQTYGSALKAPSAEAEPELIYAVAISGETGYIRKSELEEVDGTAAARHFASPEEALEWQRTAGASDKMIPVYEIDGKTVIGEFLIVGSDTQSKGLSAPE